VEIGWRLAADTWGRGLATEGALAIVRYAFDVLALTELVSFTTVENTPSRRVMEKLGMTHDPADDFDHPGVPEGHPLRRHVLYRLRANSAPWSTAVVRAAPTQNLLKLATWGRRFLATCKIKGASPAQED
jgi:Acetyltransferase (GNAT) domain